jgi:hypothetical protein
VQATSCQLFCRENITTSPIILTSKAKSARQFFRPSLAAAQPFSANYPRSRSYRFQRAHRSFANASSWMLNA